MDQYLIQAESPRVRLSVCLNSPGEDHSRRIIAAEGRLEKNISKQRRNLWQTSHGVEVPLRDGKRKRNCVYTFMCLVRSDTSRLIFKPKC